LARNRWSRSQPLPATWLVRNGFCIEGYLAGWLDTPLRDLSDDAAGVAERHREITRDHGPYSANHAMRALRAVYRHARKTRLERGLPAELPTDAVQWNGETRRNTGMSQAQLAGWYRQLRLIPNPVRQEFHLFMLLSGSRPDALRRARWADLDVARRVLHFPDPKGGARRAFDMPLSRAMLYCLVRARRAGRFMHGRAARTYIFPAATPVGCIAETKERRTVLSKFGVDLRQTYRTAAQACGLGEMDVHILMNHTLSGVSAGYITPGAILDHLRAQQEKVSAYLVAGLNVKK
jgi:integrase